MTEVWFRDPLNYVKELAELDVRLIAWNRGVLSKRRVDPVAWAELYYGVGVPVRQILIGSQGSAEVGPGRGLERPLAVYPTWTGGDDLLFLEEMMANPAGKDTAACADSSVPIDERPVLGQEHRVVLTELPPVSTNPGRNLMRRLKELQEEFPDCKLMVHGLYSYKWAFGMGFYAADHEPRTSAQKGKVWLPAGNEVPWEHLQSKAQWVLKMGMLPSQLAVPRNRCMFNIKSAIWAGENYSSLFNVRRGATQAVDIETPTASFVPPAGRALPVTAKAKDGDKTLCNQCSLSDKCQQFRADEVCSLTEGNTGELARFFGTRDPQSIIDGLSVLTQMSARRLENAVREEEVLGDTNPDVTKMINQVFGQGVTLAKLLDPGLRGGGVKVQVGVVNGQATAAVTTPGNPQELVGSVMRSLEQQGIPRDKITPELVMATIQGMADPTARKRAIEGTVIAEESAA